MYMKHTRALEMEQAKMNAVMTGLLLCALGMAAPVVAGAPSAKPLPSYGPPATVHQINGNPFAPTEVAPRPKGGGLGGISGGPVGGSGSGDCGPLVTCPPTKVCPHVCIILQPGQTPEQAIEQFEQENDCVVGADGPGGGDPGSGPGDPPDGGGPPTCSGDGGVAP